MALSLPSLQVIDGNITVLSQNYVEWSINNGFGYRCDISYDDAFANMGDFDAKVAGGGTKYLEFQCSPTRWTALTFRDFITEKEKGYYRVFVGHTGVTYGTKTAVTGNLRVGAPAAEAVIREVTAATINNPTLNRVTNLPIYGASEAGNRSSGDSQAASSLRLIAPNSKFLLVFQNGFNQPSAMQLSLRWGEIPAQYIKTL